MHFIKWSGLRLAFFYGAYLSPFFTEFFAFNFWAKGKKFLKKGERYALPQHSEKYR